MAFQKPTYSKKKVAQRFNISELLGVSVKGDKAIKLAAGQMILDKMLERTASSKDINGNGFAKYSKEYMKSDAFKARGKSKKVNMELFGDMLSDIDIKIVSGDEIEIKQVDSTEIKKSYNHNTGDTLPKRQFFGIKKKDIISDLKTELSGKISIKKAAERAAALKALEEVEAETPEEIFTRLFMVSDEQN